MDPASKAIQQNLAARILQKCGLSNEHRTQLLSGRANIEAVLSIYESLLAIFEGDQDRSIQWLSKSNKGFDWASALDIMNAGDIERVRKHLKYHVYNA